MNHRPLRPLLAIAFASLLMLACAGTAPDAEEPTQQLIECGAPIAAKVAQRASELAMQHAAADESARAELEQRIAAEIKSLVPDYAPDLLQCLVDRTLKRGPHIAHLRRSSQYVAPPTLRYLGDVAGVGFVPLERDHAHERPWHTLLAGARGVRS